ncbi:MAG TPA: hypothetical protein VFD52_06685 [Clostridia bacterium]|nr:hypothetical protein [Clostridia bacterium]
MPIKPHKPAKHRRAHRWAFPLGLLIIALAIVGAVRAVTWGVDKIGQLTDDSAAKTEYESFLTPVVMNDPDAFDDISKANMAQLIDITVWSLLNSGDSSPNEYELYEGEATGLLVPKGDIESEFERLFGKDIKPDHSKSSGSSYDFVYNFSLESYIIPLTGVVPAYTPKVYKIDTKGSSVILTVGYLSSNDWAQDQQGNFIEPDPGKYMKITLRKSADTYYLSAIQATDASDIIYEKPTQTLAEALPTQKETTTFEPATEEATTANTTASPSAT